ncbi:hypothetical protein C5Y96_03715 [Blastopirellula marina]|uniref:Uncharacterized protein n=1 Tax=Blastopirellula marina TaxID=124 RepID=A0A2S8G3F8_9BACT|nr:hypothetical protein C5Y96_03715 [Blastopirellula marina]RCS55297.1 hypothetical protein DTL36_03720 [Bremerella cremea]
MGVVSNTVLQLEGVVTAHKGRLQLVIVGRDVLEVKIYSPQVAITPQGGQVRGDRFFAVTPGGFA